MAVPRITVYVVDVVFRPLRSVQLRGAWSGVFSGKVVYDALSLSGLVLDRGGFFRVTPVYRASVSLDAPSNAPAPVAGTLFSGERYRFRAVFWGWTGFVEARDAVNALVSGLGGLDYVEVLEARARTIDVELPEPHIENHGERPVAGEFEVLHEATFYRFHGALVSYPSPWRLIASVARRISMASGIDYRPLVRLLQPCLEVAVDKTKRMRIKLTHGEEVPVFKGPVVYHVVCSEHLYRLTQQMLELAKLFGVGGSPGLGIGVVYNVRKVPSRHKLPPGVLKDTYALEPEEGEKLVKHGSANGDDTKET
ncbi:hypothetical protein [Hyperthermus butylicus]|uniref:CRISPR-associated protein Cas6 C-terminal domain-containing protein n=1 Tax=Hyperthermus butylicus (strain DSM 5456 / JCM 9403 / PLM1-5) TaxID=415426 RepID=A2BMX9_HYPBU|nr:hypothetical protein [Hyperthermus butylicus]ABM81340.1 hypothetical protein Hbut_1518 [Hyperthermus butylicus DSM 5456]